MIKHIKGKLRWALALAGLVALLAVVALLVLPRLVAPESYRGLLRASLERQLGREVRFGAMELSLWPTLGLRLDDLAIGSRPGEHVEQPVTAARLRVGARLIPLLRGRLEVTSLTVERPLLTLYRRDDGTWEPTLGGDESSAAGDAGSEPSPLIVERLRVKGARVVFKSRRGDALLESALDDVNASVDGLGGPGPVAFDVSAKIGSPGSVRATGSWRHSGPLATHPPGVSATVAITDMTPSAVLERLALLAPDLARAETVLRDRPFDARATVDYVHDRPPRLTLSDGVVRGPALLLSRAPSGAWNFESLVSGIGAERSGDASERTTLRIAGLTIEDASIRIEDRPAGGESSVLQLDSIRLTLDRLPTAGPAAIEWDARVGPGGNAKLGARGRLGPLGDDPAATPLDLSLEWSDLALGVVPVPLPGNLDASRSRTAARVRLSGSFAGELEVAGEVSLSGAAVTLASPGGEPRRLPLDLLAHGSVTLRGSARDVDVKEFALELPRGERTQVLKIRGAVDARSDPPRVDLELLPTRVAADDLAALAALVAPDVPLTFASPEPVDLELRARGPLGGDSLPEFEGLARLTGFTFHVAGMTRPMERVGAKVTFSPGRIVLEELEGAIGKSEVAGTRITITDFESPRVQLDLNSRNADFWELFSFVGADPATDAPSRNLAADDALARLTIDGTLRIERGSLQTLTLGNLSSGMDYRTGVLTLAPLEMDLYGGHFSGRVVQDLDAGVLTIDGDGDGIDADGFLAQNLALGGLISGRASARLKIEVRSTDPANALAGVSGGGPLQVVEGRIAKLDVLKSLSKVTGIFGERSLQHLTKQLATTGTSFQRAETRLGFDAGTLSFEDLAMETDEFTLTGRATLDSATGKLEGRFAVAFSQALSAKMREEKSRAAELFWDAGSERVRFGFSVTGPATQPRVSVDWDGALRGAAERKLGDRLRGEIESRLKLARPAEPEADGTSPSMPPPGEAASETMPSLAAEIARTRWTGSLLARDLTLEGSARGARIERLSLTVVDARGIEVRRIDRLPGIDEQLAGATEAEVTLSWRAVIDGKRLLAARFPIQVTVTVHDLDGGSASANREVER